MRAESESAVVPAKIDTGILHSLRQERQRAFPSYLTGGIAVPLYVAVFALMGGAVNMLRRVPEYQWRGMDVKDSLTREEARECLLFEMMQVLSSPLIAIAAYYLFHPQSQGASVALGFVAGFASHTILLTIRSVTDTLTPQKVALARRLPQGGASTGDGAQQPGNSLISV